MIIREERIGGQRLILGDCLQVMPLLGRFDHIITDPPYEQSLHDAKSSASRRIRTDGRAELQALSFAGIDSIRAQFVELCWAACNGWLIAFCTPEGVAPWANEINASPIKYKRACIWVKPDSTPQLNGQGPAMGAECFVAAWAGKGFSRWNGGGKRGVYTHNTNSRERTGLHPTEKPIPLMAELLADFTNFGQTILDPFMGSGTTLVACQRMGRNGTGIELDPDYFDIACKRVDEAARQPDLLIEAPKPQPKQAAIDFSEAAK